MSVGVCFLRQQIGKHEVGNPNRRGGERPRIMDLFSRKNNNLRSCNDLFEFAKIAKGGEP